MSLRILEPWHNTIPIPYIHCVQTPPIGSEVIPSPSERGGVVSCLFKTLRG
uniref:Uncharacterized protein n=1 Tax=Anguilla anguilla TaxID=7936 RepID=A0A0E9W8I3_ANGAN